MITPTTRLAMNKDPTIMNMMKYQILPGLLSWIGCISMPFVSMPMYATPDHPSVVVRMKRVLIAWIMLSKLESFWTQAPSPYLSRQSYFVTMVPSSSEQLQYWPLKRLTPITEKMMSVRKPMTQTFLTALNDSKKALTTCFNSGNPWIALSGLNALKDLSDFKAAMLPELDK